MDQSANVSGISRSSEIRRTGSHHFRSSKTQGLQALTDLVSSLIDEPPLEVDPNIGDEPSFTFITHGDDLQTKRIRDVSARKQIRSHVMRDVRRRERIQGLRRPSKKERSAKDGPDEGAQSISDSSQDTSPQESARAHDAVAGRITASPLPLEDDDIGQRAAPLFESNRSPSLILEPIPRKRRRLDDGEDQKQERSGSEALQLTANPEAALIDPFATLPPSSCPPNIVAELMNHCTRVFLPMTLPFENKSPGQMDNRIRQLMQSQISDQATFYAAMAMAAAHRDLLHARKTEHIHLHRWPTSTDYDTMYGFAIQEVNRRISDPRMALETSTFSSVTLLAGTSVLLGNFPEAAAHLRGLTRMAHLRGGIVDFGADSSSLPFNIFVSDVKAAAAMGSQPQLPLTSRCIRLDNSTWHRIAPPLDSTLYLFARSFAGLPFLSPTLIQLLQGIRDLCFLDEFNFRDQKGLTWQEHDVVRKRSLTIEHALLNYAFETFSPDHENSGTLAIPFLEAVARLTALSYLNTLVIVSAPSSGLGRGLTLQMYRLLQSFKDHSSNLSSDSLDLLTWSACTAIQTCFGRQESLFFNEHLKHLLRLRKYKNWQEFEAKMRGYLYNPRIQETSWQEIFNAAYVEQGWWSPAS